MARRATKRRSGTRTATKDLDAELARIESLDRTDLGRLWRELTGERPPEDLPRTLLVRLCAYRVQETCLGGLDATTKRALAAAAAGRMGPERRIKPGSVLVREHGGVLHEVTVLGEGFDWRGERFASLSAVARRITGTTWNGPRFFGLRASERARRSEPATLEARP